MTIAFLGDSITYGVPGVSYFDMLKFEHPQLDLINYGKGGDTVNSLYKRIKNIDFTQCDQVVLFVGVNDLFLQTSLSMKVIKTLKNVKFSRTNEEFKHRYIELVDYILKQVETVYVIPPLLLGEDLSSDWNKRLGELIEIVYEIVERYDALKLIPVFRQYVSFLKGKKISPYLSTKATQIMSDVKLNTAYLVDQQSHERGLHLTLDGVHINTMGAKLIKESIEETLNLRS